MKIAALLAVLMAAVTHTAIAAESKTAPLLEPLYPETYQEAETEEARAARLELDARLEIEQTEEYRAYQDEPYVDEEARRAVDARVDGISRNNLFGVPLPP